MAAPCNPKWEEQEESKRCVPLRVEWLLMGGCSPRVHRVENCEKIPAGGYIDKHENITERIASRGKESASAIEKSYEKRAEKAIAKFDYTWNQSSGSNN